MKKLGRPRKFAKPRNPEVIIQASIRWTVALQKQIAAEAARNGLSVNAEINKRLLESVK